MASLRHWWRRLAGAFKDRRSLLLARLRPRRAPRHHRELEAAVIRATSHEDRWVDYRSAARVFAWARASPSHLRPVLWALARRARRTRSWVVALKALMLAHGLLLRSPPAPAPAGCAGRVLPFDLADFRDRSSPAAKRVAFSAFVRAYFRFLDHRCLFATQEHVDAGDEFGVCDHRSASLDRVRKLQLLLDLLLQIRPCAGGMAVPLVLEAMDCALVEILRIYGEICTGIARFLVTGVPAGPAKPRRSKGTAAAAGVKVIWRAAEQSAQLSSYFELCRGLGVVNARRLPAAFVRVSDDDARRLERILMGGAAQPDDAGGEEPAERMAPAEVKDAGSASKTTAAGTEWVPFGRKKPGGVGGGGGGGGEGSVGDHWNPFVMAQLDVRDREGGNLIEL